MSKQEKIVSVTAIMNKNTKDAFKTLSGSIQINQIQPRNKISARKPANILRNFQEFKSIYINEGNNASLKVYCPIDRPRKQTLCLEVPKMGSENAIVVPKKPVMFRKVSTCKRAAPVQKSTTDVLIKNLCEMEQKVSKGNILQAASVDLNIAENQLEEIHKVLNQRKLQAKVNGLQQAKEQKAPVRKISKLPVWNPKSKRNGIQESKHARLLTTLSDLNMKLDKMQNKICEKPRYKSVNKVLNNLSKKSETKKNLIGVRDNLKVDDEDEKLEEARKSETHLAENELRKSSLDADDLEIADIQEKLKNVKTLKTEQVIDSKRISKFRTVRQEVDSVESFYNELDLQLKNENSESNLDIKNNNMKALTKSLYSNNDDSLERSIIKSNYLKKEFNIK